MPHTDRTSLVRLCDQTGRPRGTGFVADDLGTVVTGHETVDGLERVVVEVPGGPVHTAELPAITALPAQALALVRTEGLGVPPLPITTRATPAPGSYVRIHAHGWREARVLGTACAAYQATDHDHTVDGALELAIGTDGSEALRRCGAAGGPVVDAETGAVIAVLGATLHTDHRAPGLAVPLVAAAARDPHGPLAALLRRNAACAPAHGADLNLAGVVQLCAATVPPPDPRAVPRPRLARELDRFARGGGQAAAAVCAVVGPPGSGRTTELTALAARRAPAPTLHLRGTDLEPGDTSLADAVGRALRQPPRTLGASHGERGAPPGNAADCLEDALPERAARVARAADRPLVVLLDGADLLPAALAHRLPLWTARSLRWLRTHGVRLVLSCGPEFWETTGPLCPAGTLHRPDEPAERLPDAVPTGELTAREAATARERYGLAEASVAAECARHPLALRQLADVRAALPGALPGAPGRAEIFAAHTDLLCLRAARRIASGERVRDAATVRRLALGVAGQVHLAARRCLAAANGALDRESFDALFPRSAGWAAAVLAEGLLVPAGPGYRFGHEEIADWLQAAHVDLDTALDALVHAPTAAVLPQDPPPALPPAPDPAVPVQRARRGPGAGAGTGPDMPVRGDGHRPGHDVHRPPAAAGGADGQHVPGARVPDPTATGVQGPGPRLPGPPVPPASEPPWSGPYASDPPARSPHTPRPGGYEAVVGGQRAPAPVGPPAHADGVPEPYAGAAGAYGTAFPGGGSPPGAGGADGPGARPGRRTVSHGVATGATGRPELRTDDTDSTAHVPPRCVGVVVQALLREESTRGAAVLARRLGRLVDAAWADTGPRPAAGRDVAGPGWWAARLLQGTLLRAGDARPYGGVLRQLAGRIATHPAGRPGGPDGCGGTRDFGPWFWERLRLGEDERLELFRRLLPADGPAALHGAARPRYLEAVGRRLAADPRGVQPLLCRWFTDERTLRAEPGTTVPPTVAGVAQALLYTHRDLALDDLCEALVATAHPRAAELLARLTRDEPSALCRAVDRWAHDDDRPARRVAAAAYGGLLAEHAAHGADREPLRYAARALLARPADRALHGAALAVLVRDPHTRARHLPRALAAFRDGAPGLTAAAAATALTTHPEPVLAAFAARLREDRGAADVLDALAAVRVPALARRGAALVRGYARRHPGGAGHVAAYTARRLERGPAARATLLPLVTELARHGGRAVREALAGVLTAEETGGDGLRGELLAVLLDVPHPDDGDLDAAEAVLRAAALGAAGRPERLTRALVLRCGQLMRRVPAGAARFDRRLAGHARDVPGFAVLLSAWMAREPRRWEALVSAGARRAVERLAAPGPEYAHEAGPAQEAGPDPGASPAGASDPVPVPALSAMPMRADRCGHGTLRPASSAMTF